MIAINAIIELKGYATRLERIWYELLYTIPLKKQSLRLKSFSIGDKTSAA